MGLVIVLLGLTGTMFYSVSLQSGQDTVIQIFQRDQNGTPINSPAPIKLVKKAGQKNPFVAHVRGYRLMTDNPLSARMPRKNQRVVLRYRSAKTVAQLRRKLKQTAYLQVATQNVTTPSFGEAQVQRKGANFARLSTSDDGTHWTKLPISYPNVRMVAPVALTSARGLTVLDSGYRYDTSDYQHWQRSKWQPRSSQFKAAKVQTVIRTARQQLVVVRAKQAGHRAPQLFVGAWHSSKQTVTAWQHLATGSLAIRAGDTVSRVGKDYYLLQARGRRVRVSRTRRLTQPFKKIKVLSLTMHANHRVTSLNLIPVKHGQLRLIFSTLDHEQIERGPFYRDYRSNLKPRGKQHVLVTDFPWHQYQLSTSKR